MKPEPGIWTVLTLPTRPRCYELWLDEDRVGTVKAPPRGAIEGWTYEHATGWRGVASTLPQAIAALHDFEVDRLSRVRDRE